MNKKDKKKCEFVRELSDLCAEYCDFLDPPDVIGAIELVKMTIGHHVFRAHNEAAKEKEKNE